VTLRNRSYSGARVRALSEVSRDTSTPSCSLSSVKKGVLSVGVTGHADLHDQSNNLQNAFSCTLCTKIRWSLVALRPYA